MKTLPNPEFLIENSLNALTYKGEEEIEEFYNSGFKCIERTESDTVENTLKTIERHFDLAK
jgi:hypothetical protein